MTDSPMTLQHHDRKFLTRLFLIAFGSLIAATCALDTLRAFREQHATEERRRITDDNMREGRAQRDRMEAMLRALMERR